MPHVDEETPPAGNGNGHAPPISPVVRRIADEHHIDLSRVKGSGRRGRGAEGHTHERPEICPVNLDSLFGSFDQRGRHDAYQRRRGRSEQQIGAICDRDQDDKNERRDRINEIEATADATAIVKPRHVDLTSGSEDVRGMNGGAGCERRRAASSSHTPTPLSQTM